MRTVMAFGTFDLVHPGHVHFLTEAKQRGDRLVVVIARDHTVKQTKGSPAKFPEEVRRSAVDSLPMVDATVLGYTADKYKVIAETRPDVICLGYDQRMFVDKLSEKLRTFGIHASIMRLGSYYPKKYKSGLLKTQHDQPLALHV